MGGYLRDKQIGVDIFCGELDLGSCCVVVLYQFPNSVSARFFRWLVWMEVVGRLVVEESLSLFIAWCRIWAIGS
jgi:hypothetical protein